MPTDAEAIAMMKAHHAQLCQELAERAEAVEQDQGGAGGDASRVVNYVRAEILPHAAAEEAVIYPRAARLADQKDLVTEMLEEHRRIRAAADELAEADAATAGQIARSLSELFSAHAGKENDRILPALVADPDTSLGALLDEMHAQLG